MRRTIQNQDQISIVYLYQLPLTTLDDFWSFIVPLLTAYFYVCNIGVNLEFRRVHCIALQIVTPFLATRLFSASSHEQFIIKKSCASWSQIILTGNVFHHRFYLPKVNIQVQHGHGVLSRLVLCPKCMDLLQVNKNDEKRRFLK